MNNELSKNLAELISKHNKVLIELKEKYSMKNSSTSEKEVETDE